MENLLTWKDDELIKFYHVHFNEDKSEFTKEKYNEENHKNIFFRKVNSTISQSELLGIGIQKLPDNNFRTRFTQYFLMKDDLFKFKRNYILQTKFGLLFTPIDNTKAVDTYSTVILDFCKKVDEYMIKLSIPPPFDYSKKSKSELSLFALAHLHGKVS